jgi:uncharacterized protein (TIGR02391 family)
VTGLQAARIVWAGYWHDLPVTWNRSKQETLALPINALALLILRDYQETGGWNSRNWMLESKQYGTARDQEIMDALAEGWAWLTAHGLVAWNSTQSDPNAYRVTRLGEQTLNDGGARLVAAERLGVSLHHRIAQQVEEQFLLGQYDLAVFAALRDVEDRVRKLAEAPNSLLGVKLMQQAFSLNGPGPLVDTAADPGEQEAAMNLFKGAIGLFKNPTSHRAVSYDNPVIASDIILLADLLLRLLDQVDRRLNDEAD